LTETPRAAAREPLRCDWCGEEILSGHAVFYLAPERRLVHQKCPRKRTASVRAAQTARQPE